MFTIQPPALKERGAGDIKLLADFFVDNYNRNKGTNFEILPNVYPYLQSYRWPGNVRQLENVIERAINLTDEGYIGPEHLPDYILSNDPHLQNFPQTHSHNFAQTSPYTLPSHTASFPPCSCEDENIEKISSREDSEKSLIISALVRTNGRITDTAALLSMNRRTLYRRMDKLGIDPTQYRRHK